MDNTPDIALILELNAERRAIAEMLKAKADDLRAGIPPTHGAFHSEEERAKLCEAMGYREAAKMVRARIVVGVATEASVPSDDGEVSRS